MTAGAPRPRAPDERFRAARFVAPPQGGRPDGLDAMTTIAVVPIWNAGARIDVLVGSLEGQVDALVCVDNASDDDSLARLRGHRERAVLPIEIVANGENRGWPTAINQGIDRALARGADFVLLANDDLCFAPAAVEALAAALVRDARAAAATARTVYRDRPQVLNGAGGRYDPERAWAALRGEGEADRGQYDALSRVDYPSGAACLLRASLLHPDEVGRFDEAYFLYFEDVDWGLRAARRGWHTRYVPESLALHAGSAGTERDPERRRYYNLRNRLRFARIHASPKGRRAAWRDTLRALAMQPFRALWPRRRRGALAVTLAVHDHLRRRYGRSPTFG